LLLPKDKRAKKIELIRKQDQFKLEMSEQPAEKPKVPLGNNNKESGQPS
jgi:hypothetical protein